MSSPISIPVLGGPFDGSHLELHVGSGLALDCGDYWLGLNRREEPSLPDEFSIRMNDHEFTYRRTARGYELVPGGAVE